MEWIPNRSIGRRFGLPETSNFTHAQLQHGTYAVAILPPTVLRSAREPRDRDLLSRPAVVRGAVRGSKLMLNYLFYSKLQTRCRRRRQMPKLGNRAIRVTFARLLAFTLDRWQFPRYVLIVLRLHRDSPYLGTQGKQGSTRFQGSTGFMAARHRQSFNISRIRAVVRF
jgi:hypothetical protein